MSDPMPDNNDRRSQIRRIIVLAALAIILGTATVVRDGLPFAAAAPTPGEESSQFTGVAVRLLGTPTPEPPQTGTSVPVEQTDITRTPVEPTPMPTAPPPATPTTVPPDTAPLSGTYDVYLSPPDLDGAQQLRFITTGLNRVATEIGIRIDDGTAIRAGQYVYYHAVSTRYPMRVNTAGAVTTIDFTNPHSGASYYQLLPSAGGSWLAWVSVDAAGTRYTISRAFYDGSAVATIADGEMAAGTEIELLRLVNDGTTLFYSLLPPDVADRDTPFNARYNIMMLDTRSGVSSVAPGEPACDGGVACDAYVSLDGAYLARALPPYDSLTPVTVTNLFSQTVIARYEPPTSPLGLDVDLGYPFFTPGGEMIYMQAIRRPEESEYKLVFANIVTGVQEVLADLGNVRHRPLAWTGDGFVLLTTREPDYYDTWQIDLRDGSVFKLADMMYLGNIASP